MSYELQCKIVSQVNVTPEGMNCGPPHILRVLEFRVGQPPNAITLCGERFGNFDLFPEVKVKPAGFCDACKYEVMARNPGLRL